MIVPPTPKPGSRARIIAPASPLRAGDLEPGLDWIRTQGLIPEPARHVYDRCRFLAGSDADRASDLMDAFLDDSVGIIYCARGGYGTSRVLTMLNYTDIRAHPTMLVGFSDTTALQLALLARASLVTYTGLVLCPDLKEGVPGPRQTISHAAMLRNEAYEIPGLRPLRRGTVHGPLIPVCLSLLTSLVGTPYLPDLRGSLLVLEDVREEPYRIDRMLTHLRLSGVLNEVGAIVFGAFHECTARNPDDGTVEQVIDEFSSTVACPVSRGLPFGHTPDRFILPMGGMATLEGERLEVG